MPLTKLQLINDNERLHSRVIEIEEALDAIRNGEVDAIMVSGNKGEQIYTISSAETPYRTFIEEMNEGAVTITKQGVILYCNPKFTKLVEAPFEKVVGSSLKQFIASQDESKLDDFLSETTRRKHDVLIVTLNNTIYLRLSIYRLPLYLQGDMYILIATDISDLKRKENDLNEMIGKLVNLIAGLRALRIDNINDTLDVQGKRNQLETANNNLLTEIDKLNSIIVDLESEQRQL